MVTLTIDGNEVSVERGTTILKAAEKLGIFIPHYCYHPSLSIAGSCRMCLVEIEGAPRTAIACNQPVGDGMVVSTQSDKVKRAREIVMEFLLINHPLDCPECDKAGECMLQDFSFEYGSGHSRYDDVKRTPPFKDLGPTVTLRTTRCIMCTRCVRFMDEVAGDSQLSVTHRGSHNEISVSGNNKLDHPLAGNVVDICPVGSLLDKNFIHKTRVWHLERTPSVCGECSTGCNTFIDSHNDKIYRIRPRANKEVNDHWICDTGRYSRIKYEKMERLTEPKHRDGDSFSRLDWKEAFREVSAGFEKYTKTKGSVAALLSPYTVNEDAYAIRQYLKKCLNSETITGLFRRPSEEDQTFKGGFVIKGDKFPNQAGLQFVLGQNEPDYDSRTVLEKIESGQVKAAYIVHTGLSEIPEKTLNVLKKLSFLVVEDITMSPLAQIAHVVLPGTMYYEKSGTYVNYQKRLQLLGRTVMPPAGTRDTWSIVQELARFNKTQFDWTSYGDIFLTMSNVFNELKDMSHFKMDKAGIVLGVSPVVNKPVEK